jgi:K+-transporting ATPase ATPase A chain
MTGNGLLQITLYMAVLLLLVKPLGSYMARVYEGKITFLGRGERFIYRIIGVNPEQEMNWKRYAFSVMGLSVGGFLLLYGILRLQAVLPFNTEHLAGTTADLSFNTAISFITNTNWQSS